MNDDGVWRKVEDSEAAFLIKGSPPTELYDIDTTEHRIYVADAPSVEFADFQEVDDSPEIEAMELATLNNSDGLDECRALISRRLLQPTPMTPSKGV